MRAGAAILPAPRFSIERRKTQQDACTSIYVEMTSTSAFLNRARASARDLSATRRATCANGATAKGRRCRACRRRRRRRPGGAFDHRLAHEGLVEVEAGDLLDVDAGDAEEDVAVDGLVGVDGHGVRRSRRTRPHRRRLCCDGDQLDARTCRQRARGRGRWWVTTVARSAGNVATSSGAAPPSIAIHATARHQSAAVRGRSWPWPWRCASPRIPETLTGGLGSGSCAARTRRRNPSARAARGGRGGWCRDVECRLSSVAMTCPSCLRARTALRLQQHPGCSGPKMDETLTLPIIDRDRLLERIMKDILCAIRPKLPLSIYDTLLGRTRRSARNSCARPGAARRWAATHPRSGSLDDNMPPFYRDLPGSLLSAVSSQGAFGQHVWELASCNDALLDLGHLLQKVTANSSMPHDLDVLVESRRLRVGAFAGAAPRGRSAATRGAVVEDAPAVTHKPRKRSSGLPSRHRSPRCRAAHDGGATRTGST